MVFELLNGTADGAQAHSKEHRMLKPPPPARALEFARSFVVKIVGPAVTSLVAR